MLLKNTMKLIYQVIIYFHRNKETEIKKQLKENLFKSSKIERSKNQLFISDTNFSAYRLFYFFDLQKFRKL